MIVFIDTNIFYDKWHLDDLHFKLLFNFISNTNSLLFISELVCEEVDNLYFRKWNELLPKARKQLKELSDISSNFVCPILPDKPNTYSLKSQLLNKLGSSHVKFIPYSNISQTEVVRRAINRIRPFQDDDKGYRDTVIWLSFLEFLQKISFHNVKEVGFISLNNNDFYDNTVKDDNKTPPRFLDNLLKDIENHELKSPIKPYRNLASFINTNIATEEHEFTYQDFAGKYLYPIENVIEEKVSDTINEMTPYELEVEATGWHRNSPIRGLIQDQSFYIHEGIEDLDVARYKKLNHGMFYVSLSFNLRRCELIYTIDSNSYFLNKGPIDRTYDEVDYGPEETTVRFYFRPYFNISIRLDVNSHEINELVIDRLEFH